MIQLNDLKEYEKLLLVELVENQMKANIRDIRNIELTLANPSLSSQYSEIYLNILKRKKVEMWDKVKELKILINKILQKIEYGEDETGKKDEFYEFSEWKGINDKIK